MVLYRAGWSGGSARTADPRPFYGLGLTEISPFSFDIR
jgi:hypothetical protein